MMRNLIFVMFLLVGCQEYSHYARKEHKVTIVPNQSLISSSEESVWRVGPLRRQRVSKGIKVKLDFPQLERDHLQDLVTSMEIDSWIIRVKRRTLVTSEVLEHLYVPLIVPGTSKSSLRIKQIQAAFLNIYYSAAAISTRFEKFPCPAFDHRKLVTEFEVVDVSLKAKSIQGNRRSPFYFSGKLSPYTYTPYSINAGKALNGEYRFEMALFNAKEKVRKSNWFEMHQALKVTKEDTVPVIKGCRDFKIPKNDSSIDDIQDFKFGR